MLKLCTFLVADTQLYKRFYPSVRPSVRPLVRPSVCPSIRPSVRPSVRRSVRPSVMLSVTLSLFGLLGATDAVYTALFSVSLGVAMVLLWRFFENYREHFQTETSYDVCMT